MQIASLVAPVIVAFGIAAPQVYAQTSQPPAPSPEAPGEGRGAGAFVLPLKQGKAPAPPAPKVQVDVEASDAEKKLAPLPVFDKSTAPQRPEAPEASRR